MLTLFRKHRRNRARQDLDDLFCQGDPLDERSWELLTHDAELRRQLDELAGADRALLPMLVDRGAAHHAELLGVDEAQLGTASAFELTLLRSRAERAVPAPSVASRYLAPALAAALMAAAIVLAVVVWPVLPSAVDDEFGVRGVAPDDVTVDASVGALCLVRSDGEVLARRVEEGGACPIDARLQPFVENVELHGTSAWVVGFSVQSGPSGISTAPFLPTPKRTAAVALAEGASPQSLGPPRRLAVNHRPETATMVVMIFDRPMTWSTVEPMLQALEAEPELGGTLEQQASSIIEIAASAGSDAPRKVDVLEIQLTEEP